MQKLNKYQYFSNVKKPNKNQQFNLNSNRLNRFQ